MKVNTPAEIAPTKDPTKPVAPQPAVSKTAPEPTRDNVGKKTESDPLLRLRNSMIAASAHESHPTAASIADGISTVNTWVKRAGYVGAVAGAGLQLHSSFAQDGHKFGNQTIDKAQTIAAGAIGGFAGGAVGSEVGAVAGAFVGGAFGGVGAIPGAIVGGIVGETIGSYVGSNMALDDLNSIKNLVASRHA